MHYKKHFDLSYKGFLYLSVLSFIPSYFSLEEMDPCEELNCTEYEWCGQKDGAYGCFCDEQHQRANNESYGESNTSLLLDCSIKKILFEVHKCFWSTMVLLFLSTIFMIKQSLFVNEQT